MPRDPMPTPDPVPRAAPGTLSRVEGALVETIRAAHPLFEITDLTGVLGRAAFLRALLVAMAGLSAGRVMDLLVFGAGGEAVPAFFVVVVAAVLVMSAPALCARRLRDAGASRWSALLILLPVIGWAVLAMRLGRATRDPDLR
jgi:hypothetical protein